MGESGGLWQCCQLQPRILVSWRDRCPLPSRTPFHSPHNTMVRRLASQVHRQAARLLRSKYLKEEPAWYQAVLAYPPIPLPSRAPPSRSAFDLPPQRVHERASKNKRYGTPQPLPVHYLEDDVRRQFFKDHPFEAFRPVSLVEGGGVADEHPIIGKEWTRLRQRGRNPSAEE